MIKKCATVLLLAIIVVLALTACASQPPVERPETPVILYIVQDTVYWTERERAERYILKIDEREIDCGLSTEYVILESDLSPADIGELTDLQDSLAIQVCAENSGGRSDWSGVVKYDEYMLDGAPIIGESYKSILGYGYDTLNSKYFSAGSVIRRNSILDTDKIYDGTMGIISTTTSGSAGSYMSTSVTDLSQSMNESFSAKLGMDVEYMAFKGSVSTSFSQDYSSSSSANYKQYYYKYYHTLGNRSYTLGYGNYENLSSMLSENFKQDITQTSQETQGRSYDEVALYLLQKYGTHVIVGVLMGGSMEATYCVSTSESVDESTLKNHLSATINAGMWGTSVTAEAGYSADTANKLTSSRSSTRFDCQRVGGTSHGTWSLEEMGKNYQAWAESFNSQFNYVPIGVVDRGFVAIWELVDDPLLAMHLEKAYQQISKDNYYSMLQRYDTSVDIQIRTQTDLFNMMKNPTMSYVLMNDITVTKTWEPGVFSGRLDGKGHTIKGIKIESFSGKEQLSPIGMFTRLFGRIDNLTIDGITINTNQSVGGLAGVLANGGVVNYVTLKNVTINASKPVLSDWKGYYYGGMFAVADGYGQEVNHCSIIGLTMDIKNTNSVVGGFVGRVESTRLQRNSITNANITIAAGYNVFGGWMGIMRGNMYYMVDENTLSNFTLNYNAQGMVSGYFGFMSGWAESGYSWDATADAKAYKMTVKLKSEPIRTYWFAVTSGIYGGAGGKMPVSY